MRKITAIALLSVGTLLAPCLKANSDWTQFGGDSARTFVVHNEHKLTKRSVHKLKLQWKLKLDNATKELTSLTVPVVADVNTSSGRHRYAIVGGSDDNVFAIDAGNGRLVWRRHFKTKLKPANSPDWLCPNALTATPAIDGGKQMVYVLASSGQLYALHLATGDDAGMPRKFTPPFAKTWSLNLFQGTIYTPTSQACNSVRSAIYAMEADGGAPKQFLAMKTYGAGIWGRAGVAIDAEGTIFAGTGDGIFNPEKDQYPNTILAVDGATLQLKDYFTPKNYEWIAKKDLDMGNTTPVVFRYGSKELVAASGKVGVIWLLDAKSMGGPDHMMPLYVSPLLTNAGGSYYAHGFWGALATSTDKGGKRWLYAPAWGPATEGTKFQRSYGKAPSGSVMAFEVAGPDSQPVLKPIWRSIDMAVPEPVAIVNGVVFALSDGDDVDQNDAKGKLLKSESRASHPRGHAILYALDAATGKVLYSSGDEISGFAHFSGLAVADGRVFVATWDNTVYAFSTH